MSTAGPLYVLVSTHKLGHNSQYGQRHGTSAEHHETSSDHFPAHCDGNDVTVSDRGERLNSPPQGLWSRCEQRVRVFFDNPHQAPSKRHDDACAQHEELKVSGTRLDDFLHDADATGVLGETEETEDASESRDAQVAVMVDAVDA